MVQLPLVLLKEIVPYCDPIAARTLVDVAQTRFHRDHVFQLQKTWLYRNSTVHVPFAESLLSRSDYITLFDFATSITYPIYWTIAGNEQVSHQVAILYSTHPHLFTIFSNSQVDASPFFERIDNSMEIYDWQAAMFSFSHITKLADAYHLNLYHQKLRRGSQRWKRPWTKRQQEIVTGWQEWLRVQISYYHTEYFILRSTLLRARMNYIIRLLEVNIPGGEWERRGNRRHATEQDDDEQPEVSITDLEEIYEQREKDLDNFEAFILLCPCLHTILIGMFA